MLRGIVSQSAKYNFSGYRRQIKIVNTQTGNTDVENFPLYLELSGTWLRSISNGGRIEDAYAGDIRFSINSRFTKIAANGTDVERNLPFQIEYWDKYNGRLACWVMIPKVLSGYNNPGGHTTTFWINYGIYDWTFPDYNLDQYTWWQNYNFTTIYHFGALYAGYDYSQYDPDMRNFIYTDSDNYNSPPLYIGRLNMYNYGAGSNTNVKSIVPYLFGYQSNIMPSTDWSSDTPSPFNNGSGYTYSTVTPGGIRVQSGGYLLSKMNNVLNTPTVVSAITISAWIRFIDNPTNSAVYFGFGNGNDTTRNLYFYYNSNSALCGVCTCNDVNDTIVSYSNSIFISSIGSLFDSQWHYVVITKATGVNLSLVEIYIDGIEVSTSTPNGYVVNFGGGDQFYSFIGSTPGRSNGGSTFDIDEFRIRNVYVSADYIFNEYNNQNSPSSFYDISDEILGQV
jgi:hypothetical protein